MLVIVYRRLGLGLSFLSFTYYYLCVSGTETLFLTVDPLNELRIFDSGLGLSVIQFFL